MELEICLQFLTVSSILPSVAVAADRNMLEVSLPLQLPSWCIIIKFPPSHLRMLLTCLQKIFNPIDKKKKRNMFFKHSSHSLSLVL